MAGTTAVGGSFMFYLCADDLSRPADHVDDHVVAETPSPEKCDFVLRPGRRFRHTVRRAAEARGSRLNFDDESVNDRVEQARQRRAKNLDSRRRTEDKRSVVEAIEHDRSKIAAEKLRRRMEQAAARREQHLQARATACTPKAAVTPAAADPEELVEKLNERLDGAAARREEIQRARSEAHVSAERVRADRLQQARQRRAEALTSYCDIVHPVLTQFRQSGLVLHGGATKQAEIEHILSTDGRAPCKSCNQKAPRTTSCSVTRKPHLRRLVQLSDEFLKATADIRKLLHHERVQCAETNKAKARTAAVAVGTGIASESEPSPARSRFDQNDAEFPTGAAAAADGAAAIPARSPATAIPCSPTGQHPRIVSLPQYLPLAFHQAANHAQGSDDEGSEIAFAAKNVVLLLEEVYVAVQAVVSKAHPKVVEVATDSSDCEEHNEDMSDALVDACDHLRHSLSRFVRSWTLFATAMSSAQKGPRPCEADTKRQMADGLIKAYIQLIITQHWREQDIERRRELLESEHCSPALRNREAWVASKREELTSAITMQMNDLRKKITALGFAQELDERVANVEYSTTTTATSGSSPANTPKRSEAMAAKAKANCIPHVNSADWCDDDISEAEPAKAPTAAAPSKSSEAAAAQKPKPKANRTSTALRAQIAADRQRLRRAREQQAKDGNDGDDDE